MLRVRRRSKGWRHGVTGATRRAQNREVVHRQKRAGARPRRAEIRYPRARFRQHHRPERLRQEHDLQYRRRADRARRRRARLSRRTDRQPPRPRRLHDAEGSAVPLAHGAAERAARTGDARRRPRRVDRARAGASRLVRPVGIRERLSEDFVRRHAPARRADPHSDHGPRHSAARRAVLRARLPDAALSRRGAQGGGREIPQDRRAGHPRHRRGRRAVEAHRGAERAAVSRQGRARNRHRRGVADRGAQQSRAFPGTSTCCAANWISRPWRRRRERDELHHHRQVRSQGRAEKPRRARGCARSIPRSAAACCRSRPSSPSFSPGSSASGSAGCPTSWSARRPASSRSPGTWR